ncbi:hypothetical protein MMK73_000530 [Providencia rettgeri]|nr:hypothetical protein [Providencia rettgeri]
MKKLSILIEKKKSEYAQHPFFLKPIAPQRPTSESLDFLPKIAFFIMSFGDLNKFILPFTSPQNALEVAVNTHAHEDENHWPWYLSDLCTLKMNKSQPITDTLTWLWSPQMEANRKLTYQLIEMLSNQPAKIRLVIIESIEATGRVLFTYLNEIAQYSPDTLVYCGDLHFSRESGHTMGSEVELIDTIPFNHQEYTICLGLIERTFEIFREFIDEINE